MTAARTASVRFRLHGDNRTFRAHGFGPHRTVSGQVQPRIDLLTLGMLFSRVNACDTVRRLEPLIDSGSGVVTVLEVRRDSGALIGSFRLHPDSTGLYLVDAGLALVAG